MIPFSQKKDDNDNQCFSLDEWKGWVQVGIGVESNNDDDVPSVGDEPCDGDEPHGDNNNESGDDICVIYSMSVMHIRYSAYIITLC